MRDYKKYAYGDYKGYGRASSSDWIHESLALLAVLLIPFFQYLGKLPLLDPHEGRYAEISREMLERGDFITPSLNYAPYLHDPPFLYWINAISMKIFGVSDFAARFPAALFGLLTVLATFMIARCIYDRRTALLSAAIMSTSTGFVLQTRSVPAEMTLTFLLTAAMGTFVIAINRYDRSRKGGGLWFLFYMFCALTTLTSGLVGVIFPAGTIFLFLLLTRRWELITKMRCGLGLMLFLIITAPWFVAVVMENAEPVRFSPAWELLKQIFSTANASDKSLWLIIPALAIIMLPWSFHIPAAVAKAWREQTREVARPTLWLLMWIFVGLLLYSRIDSGPLISVLPLIPPLSILVAGRIKGELERRRLGLKSTIQMTGITLIILGCAALGYPWLSLKLIRPELSPDGTGPPFFLPEYATDIPMVPCFIIGALLLIEGVVALTNAGRKPGRALIAFIVCSFLIGIIIPRTVTPVIAQAESTRELALKAASLAGENTSFVTVGTMDSVSWYAKRQVSIAEEIKDLSSGTQETVHPLRLPDGKTFLELWRGKKPVLVILKKADFDKLKTALNPLPHVIMESGRRLLIRNH